MISLDAFSDDLVALVRAGCKIELEMNTRPSIEPMIWITLTPRGTPRGAREEGAAVLAGEKPSHPLFGGARLFDPLPDLLQFFEDARQFLRVG